jgi:hypothetical protein
MSAMTRIKTHSLTGSPGSHEPERLHPQELLMDMDAPAFEDQRR